MMKNWGTLDAWLREIHCALKPNGVLGVEEHRAAAGASDRARYAAVGESDRMTLRFVRVADGAAR